jgi:hypothetical protein
MVREYRYVPIRRGLGAVYLCGRVIGFVAGRRGKWYAARSYASYVAPSGPYGTREDAVESLATASERGCKNRPWCAG